MSTSETPTPRTDAIRAIGTGTLNDVQRDLIEKLRNLSCELECELAALKAELAEARHMVEQLVEHCPDLECSRCGEIICPHHEPLHFHHDGCPACATIDAASGGEA